MGRKKKKIPRGRPTIPAQLHKNVPFAFRMDAKLHLALSHLSVSSGIPKGELIRFALLRYFKLLKRKQDAREKNNEIIVDESLPPVIDYTFLFDDDRDIPDEIFDDFGITEEEFENDYY